MTKPAFRAKSLSKLIHIGVPLLCSSLAFSQSTDFASFRQQALAALGSEQLTKLEYSAEGWEGCLGQPWRISEGWARWELKEYRRVLDFSTGTSVQTAQRRSSMDPDKIGGCGAQPNSQPISQQSSITNSSTWENQMALWLTPQGFLALAAQSAANVQQTDGGTTVLFSVERGGATYPFIGRFNSEALLTSIDTRLDDTVFGNMAVTAAFGDYRDFGGVKFPGSLVVSQGGFATLNLQITGVVPNSTAASELPPRPAGGGGGTGGAPAAPVEAVTEVAPGIFVSNGAYQGVIVEMEQALVVIDGLQNDMRSAELIAQAKATIPGKPIRYVISTHAHFDHAAGLRAFAAEGAVLLTHNSNVEFFQRALRNPRTLRDAEAPTVAMQVQGVGDFFSLGDGANRIELHRLQGNIHADDMLIAYLPAIKTVVEADVLQPWINPLFGGNNGPHPFLVHLDSELDRLGLDYEKFIPVHRPPSPPFMTKADLKQVVGE